MNRMDGKVCVVTGSTQGLGAAIARRLAEAGAAGIVTLGRNADKGAAVAGAISRDTGVPVEFVRADLGSVEDCRAVIAGADRVFGRVDVLVNAGASTDRGSILDTSPDLFDRMFAINVRGPFFLMQDAIRAMIRDGIAGAIVNIGSMSEHAGQPFLSAYSASKGALATLTRNTAFAVAANRIRVNQLSIGWMSSDHERELQAAESGPEWEAKASARLPFGRLVDPAEVARAVNFLVSDDAGLLTGAVVNFDQSVWGAYPGQAPAPDGPMRL
ncbi:NAD(P)-dependent dehydrogenase (short-subunit alcohol dehydrogenase family) [Amaricoccus macauensis]|uniref:NAD(P)-dependent dehydrogenase (Short-subunit alcohol dehydrogenase family) n=1 Tax=Amaricoccus macauensis TaxID=57001 RepID=A0A840SVF9_9RHOB|nr:SDR family oxidoreductase [Amaricoccus macauensis]MBB5223141.1 NAD(P)-dependent dehydrogenase (short-subunit alcohol dehydrogenase family) [Amaricoccus macauensis]